MSRPVVAETAESLYDSLGALTTGDEANGWPLLLFTDALCSVMLERIHEIAADRGGRPGWQTVLDPDTCPAYALPYLAQFVGVALEPSLSEEEQRTKIVVPEGWARGTKAALVAAVQRTLTGTKRVLLRERYPDNAYQLQVRTLAAETSDEAATLAAILTQKPIGIVLAYEAITGQQWDDLLASSADWDAVESTYADWDDVGSTIP